MSVFKDPFSITILDPDHSLDETRFIDLGYSDRNRLLIVVYTERGDLIRLISCRLATNAERKTYEQND
ncbi:MAG: BrnT family toxin [Chloroflexi bacterium]|nr:BrnT family toxin [Chloroflexota bacterium]